MIAARDAFGIKPLYVWIDPNCISFASEVKQFRALGSFQARMNREALRDYLWFGLFDHSTTTFFEGVYQVPPGGIVMIPLNSAELCAPQISAWSHGIAQFDTGSHCDGRLRNYLRKAVSLGLRSDFALGVALSGGLDSSTVACLASEIAGPSAQGIKAVGVMFDDDGICEEPFARAVASESRLDWHPITVGEEELPDLFETAVWHFDESVVRPNMLAQFKLYRAMSDLGLRVALTGQGGDEMLCGYPFMFAPALLDILLSDGLWAFLGHVRDLRDVDLGYRHLTPSFLTELMPPMLIDRAMKAIAPEASRQIDCSNLCSIPRSPECVPQRRKWVVKVENEAPCSTSDSI